MLSFLPLDFSVIRRSLLFEYYFLTLGMIGEWLRAVKSTSEEKETEYGHRGNKTWTDRR
jgi:hypothetical protein